jgi:hypothetical protein
MITKSLVKNLNYAQTIRAGETLTLTGSAKISRVKNGVLYESTLSNGTLGPFGKDVEIVIGTFENVSFTIDDLTPDPLENDPSSSATIDTTAFIAKGGTASDALTVKAPLIGSVSNEPNYTNKILKRIKLLATVADFPNGSMTAEDNSTEPFIGSTCVRLTSTTSTLVSKLFNVQSGPVNVTLGLLSLICRVVQKSSGFPTTMELRLYSAGSTASPSANYTAYLLKELQTSGGLTFWHRLNIPIQMGVKAGTGADLTAVTYCGISMNIPAGTDMIIDVGALDIVERTLAYGKMKVAISFDDAQKSSYEYAAKYMAAKGIPGTLFPSPLGNTVDVNDSFFYKTSQMKALQDYHGWQIGSQAWLTEDPTGQSSDTFEQTLAAIRNFHAAYGFKGGLDGSFFSSVGPTDLNRKTSFDKFFRSMRKFTGLNGNTTASAGSGCTGVAVIDGGGAVTSVTLSGGTGYTNGLTVFLVGGGLLGLRSSCAATHVGGVPDAATTITNNGGVYATAPRVLVIPGVSPVLTQHAVDTLPIGCPMAIKNAQGNTFAGTFNNIAQISYALAQGYGFHGFTWHNQGAGPDTVFEATIDFIAANSDLFEFITFEDIFK